MPDIDDGCWTAPRPFQFDERIIANTGFQGAASGNASWPGVVKLRCVANPSYTLRAAGMEIKVVLMIRDHVPSYGEVVYRA